MNADLLVVGSGAAGLIAAVTAARSGKRVIVLEKLSRPGAKLKATGGGRCNLTNTLDHETFMARFGRHGRFMRPALLAFDYRALIAFFDELGVRTHAPDGFHVFPITHNAQTVLDALLAECRRLGVEIRCETKVTQLFFDADRLAGVQSTTTLFRAPAIILATGGMGYPKLGAEGDGYALAQEAGHAVTKLHPAMMPLHVQETWVRNCRADTIAKVTMKIDLKEARKLRAHGDLIFTKTGIRGPVVLDFAREITPLLARHGSVPLRINMTRGMNEDALLRHFKASQRAQPDADTLTLVRTLLPESVAEALCTLSGADREVPFSKLPGPIRDALLKLLAWTPLTVIGHDGFKQAMITRGGIPLKEIDPQTMQSRKCPGLFFCGEIMDLDGPCGGFNLQWSFASGRLAGRLMQSL